MTQNVTSTVTEAADSPAAQVAVPLGVPEFLKAPAIPSGADVTLMLDYSEEILEIALGSKNYNSLDKKQKERWLNNMEMLAQATVEFHRDWYKTVKAQKKAAATTGREVVVYDASKVGK